MDYYKFGFVIVDVNITAWEPEKSHNWTCPTPDPDIAGIGVVLSFLIAGLMTTFSSITAAVLESRINEDGGVIFLPGSIHRWLSLGMTPQKREKCRFWREIFKRLIINLADQQLITGFSLLIIAYIVEPWPLSIRGQYWPARLSLVIYLSCLSSSSHLACMLTLNKYLKDHSGLAKLRIFFIIIFAIVLSISIGLGNTFNVLAYALSLILTHIDSETAFDTSLKIANAILYGFPPLIALHVYWTAVFQLLPREQDRLERLISRFYHKFFSRLVPGRMLQKIFGPRKSAKLRSAIKRFFWWCLFLNPPMIFAMQIIFAIISIVFIFFQKFGGPSHVDPDHYEFNCRGLNNDDENKWGFGQMLAMFVLVLPVLAALETYLEEKSEHDKHMAALKGLEKTPPHTPSQSRHASDIALLPLTHESSPHASSSAIPSPDIGRPFGRTESFRSATSQYTAIPSFDSYSFGYGDDNGQSSQTERITGTGDLIQVQRSYHPDTP